MSSTIPASPRALADTYATPEDACATQDTRALLEARPRVRYARPDVTDTRGACPEGRQWQEADLSLGYYSAAPDLACLAGGDAAVPDDDDDGDDDREEEVWPVDAPDGYHESSPPVRHASMSVVSQAVTQFSHSVTHLANQSGSQIGRSSLTLFSVSHSVFQSVKWKGRKEGRQ